MSPRRGEPIEGTVDYRELTREGWDTLSLTDDPEVDVNNARAALDPLGWIPWDDVSTVLCAASGGGEQGPLFASLGFEVTVVDLSKGQLERDAQLARELELDIECVQGDLTNLDALRGRRFDLVYQPISAVYVPDVGRMYAEIASVTRPGGHYLVQHWSPVQLQVSEELPWDGHAYRVDRPAQTDQPTQWISEPLWSGQRASCVHFQHTMGTLVGGVCDAGFDIIGFAEPDDGDLSAEPGSDAHLAAFFPSSFWILARRRPA